VSAEPIVKGSAPLAVERDGRVLWLRQGALLDQSLVYEEQPELERIYREAQMRYARKKDTNHNDIIGVLRQVGAEVKETYQYPTMLDCVVGYRGRLYWADVKHGKGKLTPDEQTLIDNFARVGVTLYVWRTPEEALKDIGAT
jgi:hypothetical protein